MSVTAEPHLDQDRDVGLERWVAWGVSVVFLAANAYYFHRWAFQYNSSGTSPTYADTPFVWQAAKYPLMLGASGVLWAGVLYRWRIGRLESESFPDTRRHWWRIRYASTARLAPGLAVVAAYALLVVAVALRHDSDVRELLVWWFFVPVVVLVPAASPTMLSLRIYRTAGLILLGYHVAFSALQIFWYFSDDRLPALAYSGGLVRFGGGLDDPNGFGLMLVLPILLTLTMWRSFSHWWWAVTLLAVSLSSLFLTLSYSAAAGLVAGLLALAPIMRRARIVVWVVVGVAATAAILSTSGYIRGVISDKSRSAWSRFDFDSGSANGAGIIDYFDNLTPLRFLFGVPADAVATENGYLKLLTYFGAVGLLAVCILIVIAVRRGLETIRLARERDDVVVVRLFEGMTAFIVGWSVASLGVPYFGVFPANMLFWLVAMLCAVGPHLDDRRRAADAR